MEKLKNIIDTMNMIEKYNISGYKVVSDAIIEVPTSEYQRLLDSVVNKQYIKNLKYSTGMLYGKF